jgi:hypothetical protein
MVDKKGHIKREKKAVRKTALPRKKELSVQIIPMAIAILEAERHNNQLCRFNHDIDIDSKGRWVIDGNVIKDDPAGPYVRAARGLHKLGFGVIYMRNHPTLTSGGEPVSVTLRDAEAIFRRYG